MEINYEGMSLEELEKCLTKQQRRFVEELEKCLTKQQRRFVEELDLDNNGTQAAIRAGYAQGKDNSAAAVAASRLLRSAKVAAYRRARASQVCKNLGINTDTISTRLYEVYNRCMAAEPVRVWNKETHAWENTGEWTFNAKGATKALELLGESLGMFTQKVEQSGEATLKIELCGEAGEFAE